MSARLRRVSRVRVVAVGLVGLVAAAGAWLLLATEPGLRAAWRLVEPRLPPTLHVEQVAGRLLGPIELRGLRYESEAAAADIEHVRVVWRLLPLLRRSLEVRDLDVEGVRVSLRAPEEEGEVKPDGDAGPPTLASPLDVELARATLRDVEILSGGPGAAPTVIDSLTLSGVAVDTAIVIAGLDAAGPMGRVRLSGHVTPEDRHPFRVEASWHLTGLEPGPVVGRVEAEGDLDRVDLTTSLREPIAATFAGHVRDPLARRVVDGRLEVAETDVRRLAPEAPEATASVVVDLRGTPDSLAATLSALVDAPATGPAELGGSVTWHGGTVFVERLDVRLGEARAELAGEVAFPADGPSASLALAWSDVRWPLRGEPTVRSPDGAARISGSRDAYRVEADARVSAPPWPASRVRLHGAGTPERFVAEDVLVEASAGRLSGAGTVAWAPQVRWDVELSGHDLATRAFLADSVPWHGALSFEGRAEGSLAGERIAATVTIDTIHGTLGDAPASASTFARLGVRRTEAGVDWETARIELSWLDAEWGSSRLFVHGAVSDTLRLAWTAAVPDLGVAGYGVHGAVDGSGLVSGSRASPRLSVSLSAADIVGEGFQVTSGFVEGTVDTAPGGAVDVEARGEGITLGAWPADSVAVGVRGAPGTHAIRASLWTGREDLELAAAGGVEDRRWTGFVERLDVAGSRWGAWRLEESFGAAVSADSATVGRACWRSEPAELCAGGLWRARGATTLTFALADLPGERLSESLPAGWSLALAVGAEGSASIAEDGRLWASVTTDFGSGRVGYPFEDGTRELTYSSAMLHLDVDERGARSSFDALLTGEEGNEAILVDGEIGLPEYVRVTDALRTQPVRGRVEVHVHDFGALDALLPQLEAVEGNLEVELDVSGSVERPQLVGEARLREGRAQVPDLGLTLTGIELNARGRGLEGLTLDGEMTSGGGRLRLTGEVPVAPSPDSPARLRFAGTRVQVAALPEADVWVSPDLTVTAHPRRIGVAGQIRVPRARVELSEVPETATRPSRDVVFVGDPAAQPGALPPLGLSVRVELGDSVSFRGFGFSADPRGSVLATDGPGGTTTATGEVTLANGSYRAYGQELAMERGRILFAGGAADNPGLDIRASRTAQDGVVAGLQVSGTLRRPVVTIFSQPPMMESEALAYIVLGHPLGMASSSEGNRVANAAVALGIREGNVLAGRIAQRFGLAEVRVAADGPLEEASLVAGKYLSPALYVSYGVGLFEPISTFRLRYLLSGRWTLQAESGRSTSADLLYRVERGR